MTKDTEKYAMRERSDGGAKKTKDGTDESNAYFADLLTKRWIKTKRYESKEPKRNEPDSWREIKSRIGKVLTPEKDSVDQFVSTRGRVKHVGSRKLQYHRKKGLRNENEKSSKIFLG
ncbi:hypothetical protein P9112_009979 [Eukaryota sp. TZLM1-RC]